MTQQRLISTLHPAARSKAGAARSWIITGEAEPIAELIATEAWSPSRFQANT
jgi:hypothetical protein